jgi:hypothetical protein
MARRPWSSPDPLVRFGAGYYRPPTAKLAIERRAAKLLGTGAYERVLRSLRRQRSEAEAALDQIVALPPSKERDQAASNARAHIVWLLGVIGEVRRRRSLPKPERSQPTARRTRIGLLAREADHYRQR